MHNRVAQISIVICLKANGLRANYGSRKNCALNGTIFIKISVGLSANIHRSLRVLLIFAACDTMGLA